MPSSTDASENLVTPYPPSRIHGFNVYSDELGGILVSCSVVSSGARYPYG